MSDVLYFGGIIAACLAVLAALVFGIAAVGTQFSVHYDKAACHSFGKQAEREVRFVRYTYWSWDCLTPSSDGKWISTDKLWEETPGR